MKFFQRNDLEGLSSKDLDIMLNDCLQQERLSDYEHMIRLILNVLWEREKNEQKTIPPDRMEYLQQWLEKRNQ